MTAFGRFATWRLATQSGRSPKDGLALPPSQRSFAFQDFIAHPSLRGIVMRALVPHYVMIASTGCARPIAIIQAVIAT